MTSGRIYKEGKSNTRLVLKTNFTFSHWLSRSRDMVRLYTSPTCLRGRNY